MKYCKKWSPGEDNSLKELYASRTVEQLATLLKRTESSVTNRVITLRLSSGSYGSC